MLKTVLHLSIAFVLTYAGAQCELNVMASRGVLVPAGLENGFATKLVTPDLLDVLIACESGDAAIMVSRPSRVEDGGPVLQGPARSYLIYQDKTYTDKQQVFIPRDVGTRTIRIGMAIENKGNILPASEDYAYQLMLSVIDLSNGETTTQTISSQLNSVQTAPESRSANQ